MKLQREVVLKLYQNIYITALRKTQFHVEEIKPTYLKFRKKNYCPFNYLKEISQKNKNLEFSKTKLGDAEQSGRWEL